MSRLHGLKSVLALPLAGLLLWCAIPLGAAHESSAARTIGSGTSLLEDVTAATSAAWDCIGTYVSPAQRSLRPAASSTQPNAIAAISIEGPAPVFDSAPGCTVTRLSHRVSRSLYHQSVLFRI
jgi:hypothetical protein